MSDPKTWELRQSAKPDTFFLVLPGGPADGTELVVDTSLLIILPPPFALRPWDQDSISQAWKLRELN
ncbi:hypothetical protein BOTBODRAFT_181293 [Botryobasidium botryosum FD-172 SS1]|uniref:Uncharacterized protein n=1 Tax=Botryobasidium botryosum (strain FD-172 SS1) TaxID=930990 RepID=A0A067M5C0_BOTB1|nr:hypothetical protein BOTBODRAFT_181293 [Botryobasidium botryosum FD-172 SS1]